MKMQWLRSNEALLLLILLLLMAYMSKQSPVFLSVSNLLIITQQMAELGILALGMTIVILTAGIDLSAGATVGLMSVILGYCLSHHVPIVVTIGVVLASAVSCGMLNGLLIARLKITPILVTLGTMTFFNGIALAISKGQAFSGFSEAFYIFGQGKIGLIPVQSIFLVLIAFLIWLIMQFTPWGRSIYALGSSMKTAAFSGINTTKVLMTAYIVMAVLAAVAAIIMTSRVATARADMGSSYLLQCISAVVLGGIGLTGGKGKIAGTILGVCIFAVLSNGLNLSNITPFVKDIIQGGILIVVLLLQNLMGIRIKLTFAQWFGVIRREG